jgi:hypothetical protein
MKKTLLLFCLLLSSFWTAAQNGAISFGPMLHLNIGEKPNRLSFGLEAAYWNLQKFPAGIDVGVDFQKGVKRFYFEGQVGIGLAGVAAGPVFETKKNDVTRLGWQTNIRANYFAGVNLRWRRVNEQKTFAPGLYAKIPIMLGYDESEDSDWNDIFDD